MHVLAIYRVNEHLSDLMAEAAAARSVRGTKPKRGARVFVASLFAGRGSRAAATGPTKALSTL